MKRGNCSLQNLSDKLSVNREREKDTVGVYIYNIYIYMRITNLGSTHADAIDLQAGIWSGVLGMQKMGHWRERVRWRRVSCDTRGANAAQLWEQVLCRKHIGIQRKILNNKKMKVKNLYEMVDRIRCPTAYPIYHFTQIIEFLFCFSLRMCFFIWIPMAKEIRSNNL